MKARTKKPKTAPRSAGTRRPTSKARSHTPARTRARARQATVRPAVLADTLKHPLAAVPGKWARYHRALLAQRDRLIADNQHLTQDAAQPLESNGMKHADSASDEFDHIMTLSEMSAEHRLLSEIDGALRRMQDGTYGVCEDTGQRISAARLAAVPWTRYTREAQERREQSLARPQPPPKPPRRS